MGRLHRKKSLASKLKVKRERKDSNKNLSFAKNKKSDFRKVLVNNKNRNKNSSNFMVSIRTLIKSIVAFFKESWLELKKVVWPSKKHTIGSTFVVIVVVLLFSLFFGLVDGIINAVFSIGGM